MFKDVPLPLAASLFYPFRTEQTSRNVATEPALSAELSKDVDGGWGWVVVFACYMIHMIAGGALYSSGLFYVEFLDYYHESETETSAVLSVMIGMSYFVGPLASGLTNKFGCRAVSAVGSLFAFAGLFLSTFVTQLHYLYITMGVLTGGGFGLMYVPSIVSVSFHFEKKRATAMGISSAGSGIGTLVFSPLLTWLIYLYFWDGAMMLLSGLVLNCVVFSLLYRPIDLKKWDLSSVENRPAEENRTGLERAQETHRNDSKSIPESNYVEGKSNSVATPPASEKKSTEFDSAGGKLKTVVDSETPSASKKESTEDTNTFSPGSSSSPQTLSDPGLLDRPCVFYHGSVICSLDEESTIEQKDENAYEHYCVPDVESENDQKKGRTHKPYCPPGFKTACAEMVDFSLLYDPVFLTFVFGNFLMFIGIHVPFVFTAQRALEFHLVPMNQASYLLSVIGVSNTVGRLLFCFLSDHVSFRKLYVYNVCAAVNGISTILSSSATQYYHVILYCIVFGMMFGSCVSLASIILVELLGMNKMNHAFGLLLLSHGIASSVGSPLAGWLRDLTGSYDPGFYLSGALVTLGSLICFLIPTVQKFAAK